MGTRLIVSENKRTGMFLLTHNTWLPLCLLVTCVLSEDSPDTLSAPKTTEDKSHTWAIQDIFYCRKGQYMSVRIHGKLSCIPCAEDSFMNLDKHTQRQCIMCSHVEKHIPYQVLISSCTPDSDAVIGCADNYFKDLNSLCIQCKQCEYDVSRPYLGAPCTKNSNTVCCPEPGMRVQWTNRGHTFSCVNDQINTTPDVHTNHNHNYNHSHNYSHNCDGSTFRGNGCLAGEHVVSGCDNHNRFFFCKFCEKGTFMNVSRHNRSSCHPCSLPWKAESHILFHCNRTHDNVYGNRTLEQESNVPNIIVIVVVVVLCVLVLLCAGFIYYRRSNGRWSIRELCQKSLKHNRVQTNDDLDTDEQSDPEADTI